MRLLFLSNEFPNQVEPTKATFNYDLLTALADEHDVTAISRISWWDEVKTRLREPAKAWVTERQIGRLTVKHPRFFYTPGRLRHWYGDFLWWSLRPTVAKILRDLLGLLAGKLMIGKQALRDVDQALLGEM